MTGLNEAKLYTNINYQILKLVRKNTRILDVGCSTGALGAYLITNKNCLVHGVDSNPEAIVRARNVLTAAAVMNLGTDSFPFTGELYDIIIFGDVLEHLLDPLSVLTQFKTHLAPGGYYIASIPNIANIIIRFKLLFGKWEYKQYGIMDATHLRFFTRKTASQFFRNAGFRIMEIRIEGGVFVKDNPVERLLNKMYNLLCIPFPGLFATQYIFKLYPV